VIVLTRHAEQFRTAILASGLTPPDDILTDGLLHRFSSDGRRGDDSGWYVLHTSGVPAGAFGCWRKGLMQQWSSKTSDTMTQAEWEAHWKKVEVMRQQREADTLERQQQAAQVAAQRWQAATLATSHTYLTCKGVKAHGLKVDGEVLLIPMRDTAGALHSLQVIDPEGGKRFQPGGRVKGCYHVIGEPDGVLVVCEGYATGASIYEATGQAVAIAFNAGNLEAVALTLHRKFPTLRLILAADDDWKTDGNPGMTKATLAARAVGGGLAVPRFPSDRPAKATDFNDLYQLVGWEAVKACVDAAQSVTSERFPAPQNVSVGVDDQWPEPMSLPDTLPSVAPFDLELLPEALRGWVADTAHRMQCPPDFPAVGAVVAISSLIGARAVVAPKARDDWRVVPNLWGLIVGRPGVMKSPALGEVLKPLHRLEATEREQWKAEHDAWAMDTKLAELALKENEKQAGRLAAKDPAKARALLESVYIPAEPQARRYMVNDATVEKLGEILETNKWGTLSYRDEILGLLKGMDRQGQEGARSFYLQAYDGNQGYTSDRIIRGTHYIPRVCLAMLGGIQPGKVQSYVREAVAGGAGDDGLLQRFGLTVWPDVSREFQRVDQWPDTPAKQAAWVVFERLNQMQPATDADPQEWRFTLEAQDLYWQWVEPFETEIRGEELHPALISHLSKYRKLVPALALIFALVDTPESGNVIHERELLRALAWADYLRTHAERLYAAAVIPETTGAKQLLDKIKAGRLCDGDGVPLEAFTPRLVAVKHWTGLGTPDAVRKAANLLADYGWLAHEALPTGAAGGRPSDRYLIHPILLKGGA
jgi:putative DNA primase/helicase